MGISFLTKLNLIIIGEKIRIALAIFLISFSTVSFSGTSTGKLTSLFIYPATNNEDGTGTFDRLFFSIDNNTTTNPASCTYNQKGSVVTNDARQWAIRLDNESGQAMLATLLTAQAQGLTIQVVGSGTCIDWADREFLRFIRIDY